MAVALESEDVGGEPVEEHAVVRNDHGAAGEILQRILKRAKRLGVEIVGRFVEQDDIAALFQKLRHMYAVALTARQRTHLLLLVAALEVEGRAVGARIHVMPAQLDDVAAAGDFLPDGLVAIERVAALVDMAESDRFADTDFAAVRPLLPGDHAKQRRLAGAIGADHADNAAGRQLEIEIVDQQFVAISLAQIFRVDDIPAEPLARGNDDPRASRPAFAGGLDQFVIGADARLRLRLPGSGR